MRAEAPSKRRRRVARRRESRYAPDVPGRRDGQKITAIISHYLRIIGGAGAADGAGGHAAISRRSHGRAPRGGERPSARAG